MIPQHFREIRDKIKPKLENMAVEYLKYIAQTSHNVIELEEKMAQWQLKYEQQVKLKIYGNWEY